MPAFFMVWYGKRGKGGKERKDIGVKMKRSWEDLFPESQTLRRKHSLLDNRLEIKKSGMK